METALGSIEQAGGMPNATVRRVSHVWLVGAAAALVSGLMLAGAYRPLGWHFLAWVALVPWLVVLPRLTPGVAYLGGTLLGLVFYRLGLGWLFAINGPLAGTGIVVLAVWMGVSFRVACFLMERFGQRAMLWAVPLAFVGQEVLRCEGFPRLRFGFLALGYSQSCESPVAQIASLGGVYSLSLLIVLVNCAIAWLLLDRTRRSWCLAGVVASVIVVLSYLSRPSPTAASHTIAVPCVQAELDRTKTYLDLARAAIEHPLRPRIIVLPEHTITTWADENDAFVRGLEKLARENCVYICVGAHVRAARGAACDYDNVGLLIGPEGRILGSQAKSVPLPFFTDGNPAKSQTTFASSVGRVGIYVCYDGLFTDVPRRLADLGAEFFLVPSMDPAEWPAQERWQHADMAPYRSIELRRSAVRAGSSGISQIVDPSGHVRAVRTHTEGAGVIAAEIPACDERTVFARGGYLLAPALGGAYGVTLVLLTLADWRRKHWRRPVSRPCAVKA